jgi:hypothetical protein
MAPGCKPGARKRYAGSNPALPSVCGRCIVVMPLPSKQESRVRFPPPAPKKSCKYRLFFAEGCRSCPKRVHAPKLLEKTTDENSFRARPSRKPVESLQSRPGWSRTSHEGVETNLNFADAGAVLGTIHAMPVIVQSAAPEVIRSLPPVRVANWPGPGFVGWVTLAVAIVTMGGVAFQIALANGALDLARKELAATNETLKLARQELDATNSALVVTQASNTLVEESLRYAREQSAYIARKAELHLFSNFLVRGVPPAANMMEHTRLTFYVANYLTNQQGRSARNPSVQLLFPPGLDIYPRAALSLPDDLPVTELPDWYDGTTQWKQYEARLDGTFFPGTLQSAFDLLLLHTKELSSGVLWRLLYDDGVTPAGGAYTALTTLDGLDRSRLVASIPPPI